MQVSLADIAAEGMAAQNMPPEIALNTERASRFVTLLGRPLKPTTLKKLRCIGGGPPYRRNGNRAVSYLAGDLREWVKSETRPQNPCA